MLASGCFVVHSVVSSSLQPQGLQHARLLCPPLSPGVCSDSCPLNPWCHLTISSCHPLLLLLSIFPSIRIFSNESALHIRWPNYWSFSFSISPSNEIQGWFPLGLTGSISLQSKGLSRVFSSTTIRKQQFFGPQASLWSNSHSPYMITGKTIALTRPTFVGKVISLLFNMLSMFVIAFISREGKCLSSPSSSWVPAAQACAVDSHFTDKTKSFGPCS